MNTIQTVEVWLSDMTKRVVLIEKRLATIEDNQDRARVVLKRGIDLTGMDPTIISGDDNE